jgi:prepilin-type processing-associated H-X9-DG protein
MLPGRPMKLARKAAFSLMELLVVIATIVLLTSLLLPALTQVKGRAKQIKCLQQLREVGIAFHMFAHDHNSQFPMAVPTAAGGTLEFAQNGRRIGGDFYFGFRHFQALSNELGSPKVLVCPADNRTAAASFSLLSNEHLSYFVGITASYDQPGSVLAGDRNVRVTGRGSETTIYPGHTAPLLWTADLHQFRGNLLFADAHVEERHGATTRVASAELLLPTTNRAQARFPKPTGPGSAFVLAPASPSTVSSAPKPDARLAAARVRPEPQLGSPPDIHPPPVRSNTILTDSPSSSAALMPPAPATGSESRSVREPRTSHRLFGYLLIWLLLLLLLLVICAVAMRSWANARNNTPGWHNLGKRRARFTARPRPGELGPDDNHGVRR